MTRRILSTFIAAVAVTAFAGEAAHAELMYGLNGSGNNLFTFDTLNPTKILSGKFVTGFANAGEELLTIDVRPSNGQLYAVSSRGIVYTLNPSTGALSAPVTITGATIDGTNFGSDFNPTADALRFGSDTTQNLRVNVVTGAAVTETGFNYSNGAVANITGLAYTNNTPAAASTTLYGLDSGSNQLVVINPPASGALTVVGGTGIDFTDLAGFDISSVGNAAYAALQEKFSSVSGLYAINLTTGAATLIGQIGGGLPVRDIALVSGGGAGIPEPATLGLLVIGGASMMIRRRRSAS